VKVDRCVVPSAQSTDVLYDMESVSLLLLLQMNRFEYIDIIGAFVK
jgi:hypothetical protein